MHLLLCSDMILNQSEGNLALNSLAAYLPVNIKHRWTSKTVFSLTLLHKLLMPSLVQQWMFTFSSPSHLCDLSLTPVISLRLCPLHLIGKIKGETVSGNWRRAWWGTSPSQGPACSISHFSLPCLPLWAKRTTPCHSHCVPDKANQGSSGWWKEQAFTVKSGHMNSSHSSCKVASRSRVVTWSWVWWCL